MASDSAEKVTSPAYFDLTDQDIYEAMKRIPGYLDITPGDFKELYILAFRHAVERLSGSVTARDVMTKEVVAVKTDTPLFQVAEAMGRAGVSGVPVVDAAGQVLGVISEKDFLVRLGVKEPKNFMSVVAECLQVKKCLALPMRSQTAADIMNAPAITVREDTPLAEISRIFVEKGINRAPVVDPNSVLVGLVSRADIVRAGILGATS